MQIVYQANVKFVEARALQCNVLSSGILLLSCETVQWIKEECLMDEVFWIVWLVTCQSACLGLLP